MKNNLVNLINKLIDLLNFIYKGKIKFKLLAEAFPIDIKQMNNFLESLYWKSKNNKEDWESVLYPTNDLFTVTKINLDRSERQQFLQYLFDKNYIKTRTYLETGKPLNFEYINISIVGRIYIEHLHKLKSKKLNIKLYNILYSYKTIWYKLINKLSIK